MKRIDLRNKEILFAIGFKNLNHCFALCLIFKRKIYELGIRKADKRYFYIKTESDEMYNFLTMPQNNYFTGYYFLQILRPKDNEK